jgi:hypothetical protein
VCYTWRTLLCVIKFVIVDSVPLYESCEAYWLKK